MMVRFGGEFPIRVVCMSTWLSRMNYCIRYSLYLNVCIYQRHVLHRLLSPSQISEAFLAEAFQRREDSLGINLVRHDAGQMTSIDLRRG